MKNITTRRNFVKASSTLSAGAFLTSPHIAKAAQDDKVIKIGLVGIGGRGSGGCSTGNECRSQCCSDRHW